MDIRPSSSSESGAFTDPVPSKGRRGARQGEEPQASFAAAVESAAPRDASKLKPGAEGDQRAAQEGRSGAGLFAVIARLAATGPAPTPAMGADTASAPTAPSSLPAVAQAPTPAPSATAAAQETAAKNPAMAAPAKVEARASQQTAPENANLLSLQPNAAARPDEERAARRAAPLRDFDARIAASSASEADAAPATAATAAKNRAESAKAAGAPLPPLDPDKIAPASGERPAAHSAPAPASAPVQAGAQSHAPQQAAHAAQPSAHAAAPPVAAQIADRLADAARTGASRLSFQLHPADLGKVDIRLSMTEAGLRAVISVDNPASLEALRQHSSSLQQSLADAGLDAGRWTLSFEGRDHPRENHGRREDGAREERSETPQVAETRASDSQDRQVNEHGAISIRV